jgi:hypothetical protein
MRSIKTLKPKGDAGQTRAAADGPDAPAARRRKAGG